LYRERAILPRLRVPSIVRAVLPAIGALALTVLAACSSTATVDPGTGSPTGTLMPASGEIIGKGPVRVALLLPLSGDAALAAVGLSMANSAKLAMAYIEASTTIPDNISIVLKDTGDSPRGAASATSEAVSEGASLILGPLRAEQVTAAAGAARAAGVPVIAFSNNSGVAGPGVYLLNVLPEVEVRRSLRFAQSKGRSAIAAILPTTDYGRIQESAFRQAVADLGLNARAILSFSSEAQARTAIQQLVPLIEQKQIDAIFMPDRATAPSFGVLLQEAGIPPGSVQIIGSADWAADAAIESTPYLAGAIYPAVDDTGYQALKAEYEAKFGTTPHPFSTIGYTAVVLANASSLAMGTPRYDRAQLTLPAGFNGRDGVFRFLSDGRSEYALVMRQVTSGGSSVVDGPRL
jgi:ABC-type branched-subunit amino acid transport system substrate-binding protein